MDDRGILDGLINLHKPVGITSARALDRVRRITGQKKSGHAGTLDPAASGVLVICLGKGTKLVESMMDQPKVYRATGRLDVTSESFDSDRPLIPVVVGEAPNYELLLDVLARFEGAISQIPPSISALKVGGVPSYKRVARGQNIRLAPRIAHVYWIVLHSYQWPVVDFEVCCGRGTYIRALIRDIGQALGTGGCLTSLVRTRVGPMGLEEAHTIDSLADTFSPDRHIINMERATALLKTTAVVIPARPPTH